MQVLLNAIDFNAGGLQEYMDLTVPLKDYPRLASIFREVEDPENSVTIDKDMGGAKDASWDLVIGDLELIKISPNYDYAVVDGHLILYVHKIDLVMCKFLIQKIKEQDVTLVSYEKTK